MLSGLVFPDPLAWGRTTLDLSQVTDAKTREILQGSFNLPELEGMPASKVESLIRPYIRSPVLERDRLLRLLEDMGYVGAAVDLQGGAGNSSDSILQPRPGLQYRIGWVTISGLEKEATPELRNEIRSVVRTYVGQTATAAMLQMLRADITWAIKSGSLPFPEVSESRTEKDADRRMFGLHFDVKLGPTGRFGKVEVNGGGDLQSFESMIPALEGKSYDPKVIPDLYTTLRDSGRFKRVNINTAQSSQSASVVDVTVTLRKMAVSAKELDKAGYPGIYFLLLGMAVVASRQVVYAGSERKVNISHILINITTLGAIIVAGYYAILRVLFFLS